MGPQWNEKKSNSTNSLLILPPDTIKGYPLVASAPQTSNCRTVTSDIQLTIDNCIKRSNSVSESKYKCAVSSERLAQLRKKVETAARENKIFTIKGSWTIIRQQLLKRNWVEKVEIVNNSTANLKKPSTNANPADDIIQNLPRKQDWESQAAYVEKCEKCVMARLLANFEANFHWSMRKDQTDLKYRSNLNKIMSRFSRSLFASKEGLALLLQNYYWYTEPEISTVNFPRCYVLGFPEHFNYFVDNFRMTACIGLLKWVVSRYETNLDTFSLQRLDGKVPMSALKFAMDRCQEYVASEKHQDIDKDFTRVWDHEWDTFLQNFYMILHQGQVFKEEDSYSIMPMVVSSKETLKEVAKFWFEYDTDGMKNIWILKPGNKCRGRGIQLVRYLSDVEKVMSLKLKYVVQKYIERPLIIYNTKFDIRQWFLVTSAQPLTIWMYRECYLRFSSQNFSLENFHESLHLTNHAVQCKYTNTEKRHSALPRDNMWHCFTFQEYLKELGKADKWDAVVYPGMKQSIVCAMLASQDTMDRRQNTFELYGADFILSEDLRPWLLEINCSPDMSHSTSVTKKLCPQVLEDIIKVVIDKKRDPKTDTGKFELIYKQVLPRAPPYLGINLSVRGRRLLKNRNAKHRGPIKMLEREKENKFLFQKKQRLLKEELLRKSKLLNKIPKFLHEQQQQPERYHGPVIEDLIEELQKCCKEIDDRDTFDPSSVDALNKKGSRLEATSTSKLRKSKRRKKHQNDSDYKEEY